jgi:hypothetical protein
MRRATDVFAVLIALAGFAVSYTTQALLAGNHGFLQWEAWLWPGIADAAALAMILRLHFGLVRPGWYTVEAWAVFALAAVIMVAANTIADLRDPLSGAMHGAIPVMAMAVWHVVIHGRPSDMDLDISEAADILSTNGKVADIRRKPRPARERVTALVRRHGPDISADMVSLRLGISTRHAARLLAEAKRPTVVGE